MFFFLFKHFKNLLRLKIHTTFGDLLLAEYISPNIAIASVCLPMASKNLGLSGRKNIATEHPAGIRLVINKYKRHGLYINQPFSQWNSKSIVIKVNPINGCIAEARAIKMVIFGKYLPRFI